MGECQYCGGEVAWKDNRGWYRDFCEDCCHERATTGDRDVPIAESDAYREWLSEKDEATE